MFAFRSSHITSPMWWSVIIFLFFYYYSYFTKKINSLCTSDYLSDHVLNKHGHPLTCSNLILTMDFYIHIFPNPAKTSHAGFYIQGIRFEFIYNNK